MSENCRERSRPASAPPAKTRKSRQWFWKVPGEHFFNGLSLINKPINAIKPTKSKTPRMSEYNKSEEIHIASGEVSCAGITWISAGFHFFTVHQVGDTDSVKSGSLDFLGERSRIVITKSISRRVRNSGEDVVSSPDIPPAVSLSMIFVLYFEH